jgi:hypothetical protein
MTCPHTYRHLRRHSIYVRGCLSYLRTIGKIDEATTPSWLVSRPASTRKGWKGWNANGEAAAAWIPLYAWSEPGRIPPFGVVIAPETRWPGAAHGSTAPNANPLMRRASAIGDHPHHDVGR